MRSSTPDHWDQYWTERDKTIDEVYTNDGRILAQLEGLSLAGSVVIEVGAGSGRDSIEIARSGGQVVVLDYVFSSFGIIREKANEAEVTVHCVCADATAMPFREKTFDLVFHQGLLEHFRDPMPLLHENVRVLKDDGTVLVDVPQTVHIYTLIKKVLIAMNVWFAGWETQFTPRQLAGLLREAGLEPESTYGRFFSPSLAYRILRELLMKLGIRMPLRPVLLPPVHSFRSNLRRRVEASFLGPKLGYIIGIIAGKKRDT